MTFLKLGSMDWSLTVGIIGAGLSAIGAVVSICQSKKAKKAKEASEAAKEAVEAAKDKFIKNIQYEVFARFKKECDKFCGILQQSTSNTGIKGRSVDYLGNEFEKFITKLNDIISNSSGETRRKLERHYDFLKIKRTSFHSNDRNTIERVLDETRAISRVVSDAQMEHTLMV